MPLKHNDIIKHEWGRTLFNCKVNVSNSLSIEQFGIIGTMRLTATIDQAMHSLINNRLILDGLLPRSKKKEKKITHE